MLGDGEITNGKWQIPSFREMVGALLSLLLICLLFWAVFQVYAQIKANPVVVPDTDPRQYVDIFARSKDVLTMLFPLFTAVITFWLGIAVEGKRADEATRVAGQERAARIEAEEAVRNTRITLASATARAKAQVKTLHDVLGKRPVDEGDLDLILRTLDETKEDIPS